MNPNGTHSPNDRYWATERNPKKLAASMRERINRFRDKCDASGRRMVWTQALRLYFGLDPDGAYRSSHYVQLEGAQGERVIVRLNDFRAYVRKQQILVTGTRPSYELTPRAYDAATTENTETCTVALDRFLDDEIDASMNDVALYMLLLGEGWEATTWDDLGGEPVAVEPIVDPMTGQELTPGFVETKGSVRSLALRPDEVIRDVDVRGGHAAHRWFIISVQRDRWELAARYPQYRDEILRAKEESHRWLWKGLAGSDSTSINGDTITTYELYHRKSPVVPDGLQAILVGDCIVSMTGLAYDDLPLAYSVSSRGPDESFAYGESWDMMGPQIASDSVASQMVTTRENFGRPNIFMYTGTVPEPYSVGGARLFVGQQPPEVLDLSGGGIDSGEKMLTLLDRAMARAVGDDGEATPTSGEMLALQQQEVSRYNSHVQFGWYAAYKRMLKNLLYVVKTFVREEQMIHIVGANKAPQVRRFVGSDLDIVDSIKVDMGSTAMRGASMRYQLAQNLLAQQAITPEQYLQMISTGRYQPALETPRVLETMAERRMQIVTEGGTYTPLPSDAHALLIQRLSSLLCDPQMAERAESIVPIIMAHGDLWLQMSTTPQGMGVLAATGQAPHPGAQMVIQQQAQQAAMQAAAMMPAEGMTPPDGAPPAPGTDGAENMQNAPVAPGGDMAGAPMPSLPDAAMAPVA